MAWCYILYSPSIDSFYIGCTHKNVEERLAKHNSGFYEGRHFTKQTSDWLIYLSIRCSDFSHAQKVEKRIKRMKSRKYLLNLKSYPEMIQKLLAQA